MEKRKTKKEIVKMLLKNNELDEQSEEELLDLLVDQPISIDVDKQEEAKMTKGDKIADKVSEIAGSWGFILGFSAFLIGWMVINTFILKGDNSIDPHPFILLNLLLSCLAALQAPVIMMSQNRQAAKQMAEIQKNQRKILRLLEPEEEEENTKK